MSPDGPPKVDQDISTFDSGPISWPAGIEDSASEAHSAQRQRTFQFLIPVRRLSVISWVFARSSTRTASTIDDLLIEVAHLDQGASLLIIEFKAVLHTDMGREALEEVANDLFVGGQEHYLPRSIWEVTLDEVRSV